MKKHHQVNERIKRKYFVYLKEAKRHGEPMIDAVAKALSRFEAYTRYRDFKAFHLQQAVAFKKHLAEQKGSLLLPWFLHCHTLAAWASVDHYAIRRRGEGLRRVKLGRNDHFAGRVGLASRL